MHIYKSHKDTREELCEGETKNVTLSQSLAPSIADNSCCTG